MDGRVDGWMQVPSALTDTLDVVTGMGGPPAFPAQGNHGGESLV